MLQNEFGSSGVSRPQQIRSATHDLVCLLQLASVNRRDVRQSHNVVSISDGRRSTVGRVGTLV
eukprot:5725535-Pleurochrysis_carterae.AAC.3